MRLKRRIGRALHRAAWTAERGIDAASERWRAYRGLDTLRIAAYKAYGTPTSLCVRGRVLEGSAVAQADPGDSAWRNLKAMGQRFASAEVPGVRVRVRFGSAVAHTTSDEEGYFCFNFDLPASLNELQGFDPKTLWHPVHLDLPDHPGSDAEAQALVPPQSVQYIVVSDLDDTVLETGATRLWQMLRTTFLHNAYTRRAFPGVARFYQALHHGRQAETAAGNPLFYLSSSPWNLHDFLVEFLRLQEMPEGPLLLRDLGISKDVFISSNHHDHKFEHVASLLEQYAQPFVLVGDSGQHDAEIYRDLVLQYPGRIEAVYIRNVGNPSLGVVKKEVEAQGVPFVVFQHSDEAARHAERLGLILPSEAQAVEVEAEAAETAE